MSIGKVFLVGAGPGDLSLVTLHAQQLVSSADVLVYDYLVHPEMIKWAKDDCEIIYVGKTAGNHTVSQEEIEKLLVERAKQGKQVVRLKGGDPFIFGRGGEEARTLAKADVRFEVVPGVTAALAAGAYAGIPLTYRNTATSVMFLTGHEDPNKQASQVDWRAIGGLKHTTLAIYMGMRRLEYILSELQAGGMDPQTPAAVVQWASLGRQRSAVGTVADLVGKVAEAGLTSPSVIFVGEVVREHAQIDWFAHLPLFEKRITITRTRDQNSELRDKLEALGAEVVELPLIRIEKDVEKEIFVDILTELGMYDWIVFTSANGVRYFFEEFFKGFPDVRALGLLRFACVGKATAREVEKHRIRVECIPDTATGDSLGDALVATGSLDSAKIIVVTGNLNRDRLVRKIEAGGGIVDRLPLYRTIKTDLAKDPVAADFRARGADAILFASSSAASSFDTQSAALALEPGAQKPLIGSIGLLTSETLTETGRPPDFVAERPSLDALIDSLVDALIERSDT